MQIIENFRLRPDPRNYGTHEDIPQKVCDEVNDYNPFEIIRYLEGFNEACKTAGKTVVVEVFIEYSPDPIGSLTKCPAMGGWYRGTVYLGDVVSVFQHLYNVTRQRFVGCTRFGFNEDTALGFVIKHYFVEPNDGIKTLRYLGKFRE